MSEGRAVETRAEAMTMTTHYGPAVKKAYLLKK